MKKNIIKKLIFSIIVIILLITLVILYSEKIHKISFIENIKQIMNLRRNFN